MIDFFTFLDDSNFIMNDSGEIILLSPLIEIEGPFQIDIPIKISSNCNTVIKCDNFFVSSEILSFSMISFETTLHVQRCTNFSITNCSINHPKTNNAALIISGCENATLSHLTITDSDNTGLLISNSIVTADNLSISNINESFISCQVGSYVTIADSQFHQSKKKGICIKQSCIEIDNCTFSDIQLNAIESIESQCTIKNSKFQTMNTSVSLSNSNDFLIEKNHFNDNKLTTIFINNKSKGAITDNTICDSNGNGINVCHSDVLIKNNNINNILFPCICVDHSISTIFGNKISKSKRNGISVRNSHDVEIKETEISDVEFCAISISDTNSCLIQDNKIKNCKKSSIEIFNYSTANVKNNDIKNINENAFHVFLNSFMNAKNNTIENVKESFVKLEYKGRGEFINNRISNCSKQFEGKTTSFYYFFKNGNFPNVTNNKSRNSSSFILDECLNEDDNDNQMCLKCNKNKRDCFIFNCKHKSLCKECAQSALNNKELCPLCNLDIKDIQPAISVDNDDLCIICYEKKANCIISPCGHIVACCSCMKSWLQTNRICPFCRKEVSIFRKIYDDF